MPPLPASAAEARRRGAAVTLAWSIESARLALEQGSHPEPGLCGLFTSALAELIRSALRIEDGDPAFQAQVLREQVAEVDLHVRLSATAEQDRRNVRALVDALAHPQKLRRMPGEPFRDTLSQLHALAAAGAWDALEHAAADLLRTAAGLSAPVRGTLQRLVRLASLQRLRRGRLLASLDSVKRYQALVARRRPLAGGALAFERGAATEDNTLQAFRNIALRLNGCAAASGRYRVVSHLLVPAAFAGPPARAKGEWDVALLCRTPGASADALSLLAEAKASPDAATQDLPRLVRGLHRLSQAEAGIAHAFPAREGAVFVHGESLRRLRPDGHALPPQVVYCCDAPAERHPAVLGAASRAQLLTERHCLAFASRLAAGEAPADHALRPVWERLLHADRLRPVLQQYATACAARGAMLHPDDLLHAVDTACSRTRA